MYEFQNDKYDFIDCFRRVMLKLISKVNQLYYLFLRTIQYIKFKCYTQLYLLHNVDDFFVALRLYFCTEIF